MMDPIENGSFKKYITQEKKFHFHTVGMLSGSVGMVQNYSVFCRDIVV